MKSIHVPVIVLLASTFGLVACNEAPTDEQNEPAEATEALSESANSGLREKVGHRGKMGKLFTMADKDNDGKVTEAESRAAAKVHFAELDANKDGYLEGDEMPHKRFGKKGGARGARMFERMDKDGDGKISKEEAPARMASRFDEMDANGDGFVTQDEVRAKFAGKTGRGPMARADSDGDGKVSLVEFEEAAVAKVRKADSDGDGAATQDEFKALFRSNRGHHGKRGRGHGMRGKGRMGAEQRFAMLDANKDGKVTKAEADDGHKKRFAEIDKNGDGAVDAAEMTAHRDAKRGERRGGGGSRMLRMDTDNDGKVTAAEFQQKHAGWFVKVDEDGDGAVTLEELRAGRGGKGRGPRR